MKTDQERPRQTKTDQRNIIQASSSKQTFIATHFIHFKDYSTVRVLRLELYFIPLSFNLRIKKKNL